MMNSSDPERDGSRRRFGRPRVSPRFLKFVAAGGTSALLNFAARIAFNMVVGYATAITLAYFVGLASGFLLNRLFVFDTPRTQVHHQIFWYVTVNLIALPITLGVSLLMVNFALPAIGWTWHSPEVAHVCGMLLPIVTSYFGHKHLSFK